MMYDMRKKYSRTVGSKGQVVIPAELRRRYQISNGTTVHFVGTDAGVMIRPVTRESIARMRGRAKGKGLPRDIPREADRDIR